MSKLLQPRLPNRTLEILNAILFAVTLAGAIAGALPHLPALATAAIAVLLVAVYVLVAFSRYYSTYTFRRDSPAMIKFFTEWYASPGDHMVFCDNLEWMEGPANATIRSALAGHGKMATVCLRQCSGPIFEELQRAGVKMRKLYGHVNMSAKISINHDDGFGRMIVRIKNNGDDDRKVRFRRFSDDFSTDMAREFIINSSESV